MTRGELVVELAATTGARHEARFIADEVLGTGPATAGDQVSEAAVERARGLAARRRSGEPLQYVLGHWSFRTLDLMVDPRVLVPRPETEQVVEVALDEIRRLGPTAPVIVDAGTGSGAIALAMATELARSHPNGRVWATEDCPDALDLACANGERISRAAARPILPVSFIAGSWLTTLPSELLGALDLVVSNPPYIDPPEWPDLPADVRCEPARALLAGDGTDGTPGLGDVEEVLRQSWEWLDRPGGVVVELSPEQAERAILLAQRIGFADVHVAPDLAGLPRALVGRAR